MAKTTGHGNANWSKEETILALDLLLQLGGVVPAKSDPKVIALSEYLRSVPLHPADKRNGSFRNPDGVAFKLQNLRAVATGKGLQNVSQTDREVWAQYGSKPLEVSKLAAQIRSDLAVLGTLEKDEPELPADEEFAEGATATKLHVRRERSRKLRNQLVAHCAKTDALLCAACGVRSPLQDASYATAIFEAHHIKPLAGGPTKTTVADLALLCANCHRLLHRLMATQQRWIGVPEFRALLLADATPTKKAA